VAAVTAVDGDNSYPLAVTGTERSRRRECAGANAIERGDQVFKSQCLAVLTLLFGVAHPAAAFEEAAISLQELSDGSIIEFESSFCEVAIGDTVSVMLMGDGGDAAEATVVAATAKTRNGATPNRGKVRGAARAAYVTAVIGMDGRVVEIALDEATEAWKAVHVQVEISTGDKLGVNLHSTACESGETTG
jgi:hypothetical protein